MPRNDGRQNVTIDAATAQRLQALARREERSIPTVLRRALDVYEGLSASAELSEPPAPTMVVETPSAPARVIDNGAALTRALGGRQVTPRFKK